MILCNAFVPLFKKKKKRHPSSSANPEDKVEKIINDLKRHFPTNRSISVHGN